MSLREEAEPPRTREELKAAWKIPIGSQQEVEETGGQLPDLIGLKIDWPEKGENKQKQGSE